MAPLCAVIIVDYFIVRKGNIHILSCYIGNRNGLYWFTSGVNYLGALAWLFGTTMGIPGLIGQYQPQIVSNAAKYMYMMGWLLTFFTSATIYYIATAFIKPRIFPSGFESVPIKWEWLANDGREGFFDGERDSVDVYRPCTPPMMNDEEVVIGEKSPKATAF
jgi:NCS1 family nucleobase:cation symporter-1